MNLINMIYPKKCPMCQEIILEETQRGFCQVCYKKLPWVEEPSCKRCGKPIQNLEQEYCLDCSQKPSFLTAGVSLWIYDQDMKRMMRAYKYDGHQSDGKVYGRHLAEKCCKHMDPWGIGFIVPVPLHKRKRWFRGYNQAEELANCISERSRVRMVPDLLVRTRNTKAQNGLDDKQRLANLKNAFALNSSYDRERLMGKNILLVDDIYTTGATLEGCAELLLAAGVSRVYFTCLCIGRDF